jgi:hypothetical protein
MSNFPAWSIPDPTNLVPPSMLTYVPQDYAQGFNAISTQIQERLNDLPLLGPVHKFLKWEKLSVSSNATQDLFFAERADGKSCLNTWFIVESSLSSKTSPDDSMWFTRRTNVELHGALAIEDPVSTYHWRAILKQIDDDLLNGDQTFNNTCLTMQPPGPADGSIASWCGIDCHVAIIRFQIEEAGVLEKFINEFA